MKLGSLSLPNRVVVAPIAGFTDYAFRTILRRFTPSLMFAEMVSVRALVAGSKKTLLRIKKEESHRPLGVQLFGGEPKYFREAAKMVEDAGFDLVDINFGCPKVPGEQLAGSRLLRYPKLVQEIIRAVRKSTTLPFTIKMRAGYSMTSINCAEIARIAEGEGVDGITIHGRTCKQRFSGRCNWDWIRMTVQAVSIPVIGNGDVRTPEDAKAMLGYTGAQAVMIGRAALGRPWVLRDVARALQGLSPLAEPTPFEIAHLLLDHLEITRIYLGEDYLKKNLHRVVMTYFKSLPGVKEFRRKISQIRSYEEVRKEVLRFAESFKERSFHAAR